MTHDGSLRASVSQWCTHSRRLSLVGSCASSGHELVARAVARHDVARRGGIILELLPEVQDVEVDRARARRGEAAPDRREKLVPRDAPPQVPPQVDEDL